MAALLLCTYARSAPDGRARFEAHGCAACHKIGSRGGTSGPDLTLVGFRRSKEWLDLWLKSPRAWKPDTRMPEFRLRDSERQAIVDYLSSLTEADHSRLTDGRAVFAKAGCVACHGAGGRGGHPNNNVPGDAIPALSKVAGTYTREEMIKKISRGSNPTKARSDGPDPMARMPKWSEKLSDKEIADVADYVLTLAEKPKEDF